MSLVIRAIGIARATMNIGVANIVYNVKRLVTWKKQPWRSNTGRSNTGRSEMARSAELTKAIRRQQRQNARSTAKMPKWRLTVTSKTR